MAEQLDPTSDATQDGLSALNHPLRRQLLRLLIEADEPTSPRELAITLDKTLTKVSYHVRVLARCGAVSLIRTEPARGSIQHLYVATPEFVSIPWVAANLSALAPDEQPEANAS